MHEIEKAFRDRGYGTRTSSSGGYCGAYVLHVWQRDRAWSTFCLIAAAFCSYVTAAALFTPQPEAPHHAWAFAALAALGSFAAWHPQFRATFTFWDGEPTVTMEARRFDNDEQRAEALHIAKPHCGSRQLRHRGDR